MWLRIVSLVALTSVLGAPVLAAAEAPAAASSPAAAGSPAPTDARPPAPGAPPPAAAKLICQTQDETGSHMAHKVCLTQAQWASLGDDAGPAGDVSQVPVIGPSRPGGFGSAPRGR